MTVSKINNNSQTFNDFFLDQINHFKKDENPLLDQGYRTMAENTADCLQGFFSNPISIKQTLGEGSFGSVHLISIPGDTQNPEMQYVLKILSPYDTSGYSAVSSDKIGGEALSLTLPENSHLVKPDFVVTYDMRRNGCKMLEKNALKKLEANPTLRKNMRLKVIAHLSPYVQGAKDLYTMCTQNSKIPLTTIRDIAYQALEGLAAIHADGKMHRDIKLENLLYTPDGIIKIIDMGFLKQAENKRQSGCGSLDYAAPELMSSQNYNEKVDLYSLGVVLYALALQTFPEAGHNLDSYTTDSTIGRDRALQRYCIDNASTSGLDFLGLINMLTKIDPTKRYSAEQALRDPFFKI